MILGDGFLADGIREAFGDVDFTWVAHHPELPDLGQEFKKLGYGKVVVISTPILVGTIAKLEAEHPHLNFAYLPENVRQAHPDDWKTQARHVIGARSTTTYYGLRGFFDPTPCMWMSPESAEMVKHALNGFLALSCDYAVKVGRIAAENGADPEDVALGMMSDPRIGMGAYLKPAGVPGPNLRREVDNLTKLGM